MAGQGGITDLLIRFATCDVPQDAAQMMRLSLFDWAACGIAGARDDDFADFAQIQMTMAQIPSLAGALPRPLRRH